MRLILLFVFAFIQACSTPSHLRLYEGPALGEDNEVTFKLPLNFEIISLDYKPISQYEQVFRNHALSIKLAPGQHNLVLQYSDVWEIDAENHDKVTSGLITFDGHFKAGAVYHVQTQTLLSYDQAKAFVISPEVQLVSEQNKLTGAYTPKDDPLRFGKDEKVQQVNYPNLRQLKFWWANANEYERKSFKQWLSEQP